MADARTETRLAEPLLESVAGNGLRDALAFVQLLQAGFDFEPEIEFGHDVRNAGVVGEPLNHLNDFILHLGHM